MCITGSSSAPTVKHCVRLDNAWVRFVESQCDLRGKAVRPRQGFEIAREASGSQASCVGVAGEHLAQDSLVSLLYGSLKRALAETSKWFWIPVCGHFWVPLLKIGFKQGIDTVKHARFTYLCRDRSGWVWLQHIWKKIKSAFVPSVGLNLSLLSPSSQQTSWSVRKLKSCYISARSTWR